MDYLIVFFGGLVVGALLSRVHTLGLRILAAKKAKKKDQWLLPPTTVKGKPNAVQQDHDQQARARYRTMWGPMGDKQGE